MNKAEELRNLITLEEIEHNLFRGSNQEAFGPRLFGGQVLAQALSATRATVDEMFIAHSLHGYFLRPGDINLPVLYRVERIRDGRSFVTRRVKAIQHGRAIFSLDASFQVQEDGLHHQMDMAPYPAPADLEEDGVTAQRIPAEQVVSGWAKRERAFDIKSVNPLDKPPTTKPLNPVWLRYRLPLVKEDPANQQILAYASDMGFVSTAYLPHREQHNRSAIQMASLDHAIWFHQPFSMSDWLLYVKESPTAAGSRGFNRGAFYTEDGQLVASTMQEGLMRVRNSPSG